MLKRGYLLIKCKVKGKLKRIGPLSTLKLVTTALPISSLFNLKGG